MIGIIALLQLVAGPHMVRNKDPITDQESILAIWINNDGDSMAIACEPKKEDLKVGLMVKHHSFGRPGILNSEWPIIYRFDQQPPLTEDWSYNEDTAQQARSSNVASFVRSILHSRHILFRGREDLGQGDQFDVQFEIGDAGNVVKQVVQACGASKAARKLSDVIH